MISKLPLLVSYLCNNNVTATAMLERWARHVIRGAQRSVLHGQHIIFSTCVANETGLRKR